MERINQLLRELSKLDKRLNNLYKRNRIVNYQIQQTQYQRMSLMKKIEHEQQVFDKPLEK